MCSAAEQELTPGSVNPEVNVEPPRPDGAAPEPDEAVRSIVDQIMKLDLVQIVAMRNLMAERLGIDPNASVGVPMAGGAGAGAGEDAGAAEEKTEFTVKLAKFDAGSKIKIIKEVRALTGLGLKEAKAAVEDAPTVLKENISKEDADAIVEKLKAVGAECELE